MLVNVDSFVLTAQHGYYSDICLEGLRNNTINHSQDKRCSGRDSNRAPLEALPAGEGSVTAKYSCLATGSQAGSRDAQDAKCSCCLRPAGPTSISLSLFQPL